jgi:hypothetical protein
VVYNLLIWIEDIMLGGSNHLFLLFDFIHPLPDPGADSIAIRPTVCHLGRVGNNYPSLIKPA